MLTAAHTARIDTDDCSEDIIGNNATQPGSNDAIGEVTDYSHNKDFTVFDNSGKVNVDFEPGIYNYGAPVYGEATENFLQIAKEQDDRAYHRGISTGDSSGTIEETSYSIESNDVCWTLGGNGVKISHNSADKATAPGDSGGPWFIQKRYPNLPYPGILAYIIGVHSASQGTRLAYDNCSGEPIRESSVAMSSYAIDDYSVVPEDIDDYY